MEVGISMYRKKCICVACKNLEKYLREDMHFDLCWTQDGKDVLGFMFGYCKHLYGEIALERGIERCPFFDERSDDEVSS